MAKIRKKFLQSGQYYIATSPMILETLVGSCVAVCIYNRKNGSAAMNHFLLGRPERANNGDIGTFGTTSTEYIISRLLKEDPVVSHYRAQVFGGAAVLKNLQKTSDIGADNLAGAMEVLKRYHIRTQVSQTGGNRGRRICFDTDTNEITCRFTGDIPRKKKPVETS